jgi:hypothetical protein
MEAAATAVTPEKRSLAMIITKYEGVKRMIKITAMQGLAMEHTSNAAEAVDNCCEELTCWSEETPELTRSEVQLWPAVLELVRSDSITGKMDGFWPKRRLQEIVLSLKYCRQTPMIDCRSGGNCSRNIDYKQRCIIIPVTPKRYLSGRADSSNSRNAESLCASD